MFTDSHPFKTVSECLFKQRYYDDEQHVKIGSIKFREVDQVSSETRQFLLLRHFVNIERQHISRSRRTRYSKLSGRICIRDVYGRNMDSYHLPILAVIILWKRRKIKSKTGWCSKILEDLINIMTTFYA